MNMLEEIAMSRVSQRTRRSASELLGAAGGAFFLCLTTIGMTLPVGGAAHAQAGQAYGVIVAEQLSGKCIDINRTSRAEGARTVQWECHGNSNQQFAFVPVGDSYRIVAAHSEKCLGVANSSTSRGARVVQMACEDSANQLWSVAGEGNDKTLSLVHSGLCMNVSGNSARNGASIIQWPCEGNPNEKFAFALPQNTPNYGAIVAERLSGKCVDIDGASEEGGAGAVQWDCQGNSNQQFSFVRVGDNYRIHAGHSGKCLGVDGASTSRGASIVQMPCRNSANQLWSVTGAGADRTIVASHSNMCMDVSGRSTASGAKIIQWPCQGSVNQQWRVDAALDEVKIAESTWEGPFATPLVAVAAANLPDGRILMWSAYAKEAFGGSRGFTATAIFDPETGRSTERTVQETGHDMFCPGTSQLADGRIMITGGSNAGAVTIYDPRSDSWSSASRMNIPRGYHAQTTLSDGSVFTVGGSWSGGIGGKSGEVWRDGAGWRVLSGVSATPLQTQDDRDTYRSDNHMWLFQAPNGLVFQAGPSRTMHWIDTSGNGDVFEAGQRGNDGDAMNGNAVMFDIGKILAFGGAPNYDGDNQATNNAHIIDINGGVGNVRVETLSGMIHRRTLPNSAVLPSGEVVVVGGQDEPYLFSDRESVLNAEIWNPRTKSFTELAPMTTPRNYHATALLMKDGRVMVAGSGLCGGCETNHFSTEILTPPYLLDSDGTEPRRPFIASAPEQIVLGGPIDVVMDTSGEHSFALVRLSIATHSVDNDKRRVPLTARNLGGGTFRLDVPSDPNILLPGNYFLFAMDDAGVPSIGTTVNVQ